MMHHLRISWPHKCKTELSKRAGIDQELILKKNSTSSIVTTALITEEAYNAKFMRNKSKCSKQGE